MNIKLNTDNMSNTVTVSTVEYNPMVINTDNMSSTIGQQSVSVPSVTTINLDGVESIVTSLTTNIDPVEHSHWWYDFDRNK